MHEWGPSQPIGANLGPLGLADQEEEPWEVGQPQKVGCGRALNNRGQLLH